jgi:hypothetical protein
MNGDPIDSAVLDSFAFTVRAGAVERNARTPPSAPPAADDAHAMDLETLTRPAFGPGMPAPG